MKLSTLLLAVVFMFAQQTAFAKPPLQEEQGKRGETISKRGQGFADFKNSPAFKWAKLAYKLQLTPEQRDAIKLFRQEARDASMDLIEQIVANRAALKELVKVEPYDAAQAQLIADTIGDLSSELIAIRAGSRAAVRAELTDEQKALLESLRGDKDDDELI